ncbi:MAG: RsmB/NOP family class I SAM-dependent RNA methyltransferase [Candidatus Poseidoniales archaeon]|nr:MAG: RsmB/NOP family class I SAM-dependent RNA methyltransferase [Candidatus Poseidoniales archaeon]
MAISQEYWNELGKNSILLNAVRNWRDDPELWFSKSVNRLSETVRVNYLRKEWKWVEEWLLNIGAKKIEWFRDTQGSAWTLPFERGKAEGDVKSIISSLHRTGRITRQEAVSMIPTIALEIKPGEIVLDMCASPGSKTTQIAENLQNRGLVIANEIANNRINTLVSNIQRHGNKTSMIIQHDGRHIPKILNPGFDKILVDVPCTGSGTTRKNPEVWKKWLPSGGQSLHNLQVELLRKAINLTKPGGRIVYSTCSLDPIENEAVIAEVLRDNTVEILSPKDILKSIPFDEGFTEWPKLDDSGGEDNDLKLEKSMLPPTEKFMIDSLKKCVRIWNDKIDGSGFFISILEKRIDAMNPDERKNSFLDNNIKPDPENFPNPISKELRDMITNHFGKCPENLWIRGRKISWTTDEAKAIWKNEKSRKSGRVVIPGNRWRPLKIISLGLDTIKLRNNKIDRIIGRSSREIISEINYGHIILDGEKIDKILIDEFLLNEDFDIDITEHKGGLILIDERDGSCIPVWIGNKVSLMINDDEKRILRFMKGLDISNREEE